jgi:hypothetical protein
LSQPACFASLDPATHQLHRLNGQDRLWPQTNCSVDLWISVLAASGFEPEAMLGLTLPLDFEGDHFTFFKPAFEDLEALYGLRVQELGVYDAIERQVTVQLARGRLCLVEVDSFFLPDTRGVSYRLEHGKTTIGINRLDLDARRMEYFHNGGYHAVAGEDIDGLLHGYAQDELPFLPYTEFVKFGAPPAGDIREMARTLLKRRLAQRPEDNPVRAFQVALPEQARAVAERPQAFFHRYAFHGLRHLGANFELLADHLVWLDGAASEDSALARRIAEVAKAAQFQLARACARKKFDTLPDTVEAAVQAYDALYARLAQRA